MSTRPPRASRLASASATSKTWMSGVCPSAWSAMAAPPLCGRNKPFARGCGNVLYVVMSGAEHAPDKPTEGDPRGERSEATGRRGRGTDVRGAEGPGPESGRYGQLAEQPYLHDSG